MNVLCRFHQEVALPVIILCMQIASSLRLKEKCIVKVEPQLGCDYVCSQRVGVVKKMVSGERDIFKF